MGDVELSRWRDALIVDRDDSLIDAAKRWLGPVKTPFNKHELISNIESFLRRRENSDAIVGLLIPDFYFGYLEAAIDEGGRKVRGK